MMAALSRWRDTNAPSGGLISEQPITAYNIESTQIKYRITLSALTAAAAAALAQARIDISGRHDLSLDVLCTSPRHEVITLAGRTLF